MLSVHPQLSVVNKSILQAGERGGRLRERRETERQPESQTDAQTEPETETDRLKEIGIQSQTDSDTDTQNETDSNRQRERGSPGRLCLIYIKGLPSGARALDVRPLLRWYPPGEEKGNQHDQPPAQQGSGSQQARKILAGR